MTCVRLFVIYVLLELVVISPKFISAKPVLRSGNSNKRTNVEYNLKTMDDDSLLTTDVDLEHNDGYKNFPANTDDSTQKAHGLPVELEKQTKNPMKIKHGSARLRHGGKWKSKEESGNGSSKLIINRKSREEDTDDIQDDQDQIQSKDEDEDDDDVQLIIIPRKPRKRMRPKVGYDDYDRADKDSGDAGNSRNSETFENLKNSENTKASQDPEEDQDTDNKDSSDDSENPRNSETFENLRSSENSRTSQDPEGDQESDDKDSSDESRDSSNSETLDGLKNSENAKDSQDAEEDGSENLVKRPRDPKASRDDDSVTLESVDHEDDGKHDDYDLHVKVKDKSGTNVKLSGDLPGNIGNLMAEGEGGGRVQLQNDKNKENLKPTQNANEDRPAQNANEDRPAQNANEDANDVSTEDIAQNVNKMKSGKLKHAPYPATVLLKGPDSGTQDPLLDNVDNEAITGGSDQEISVLKSKDQDKYSSEEVSNTVLRPPSHGPSSASGGNFVSGGGNINKTPTNQQPSNNAFSTMEFENGDDELVATSRLLDIARKADDESSLKEVKDSSNSKSAPAIGKQRSSTYHKPLKLAPEDYKKQSEDVDKESEENWYKMQSLEDRVVNQGSTAKPGQLAASTMVLPDSTIHGTRRHSFEVHSLSDVSGGKWKAVHIPDEEISSMLKIAKGNKGDGNYSLDIEHEQPTEAPPSEKVHDLPVKEVHGRVHAFEHDLLRNTSRRKSPDESVGNLIVAMENEERGKEVRPLHVSSPSVIQLRGKKKIQEEGPHQRQILAHQTSPARRPSLVVAQIPDDDNDDDDDDELPLQRSTPDPIVASLRKSPAKVRGGAMRSMIHPHVRPHLGRHGLDKASSAAWLNSILDKVRMPSVTASLRKSLSPSKDGGLRNTIRSSSNNTPSTTSPPNDPSSVEAANPRQLSIKKTSDGSHDATSTGENSGVLEKIKSLLLKSHSKPEDRKSTPKLATRPKAQTDFGSSSVVLKTAPTTGERPLSSLSAAKATPAPQSNAELLAPETSPRNAFTNHAQALDRISSSKKEALLVGIIKALLAHRGKTSAGFTGLAPSTLPHYNKQAVLQGIKSLQMQKTSANAQNNDVSPEIGPPNPVNRVNEKSLDDYYEKQRQQLVREELGRANEESLAARKMSQEEGSILENYDRFSNPEDDVKWKNLSPKQSQTGDGQTISLMGPQQLNMIADNPSGT